MPIGSFTNMFSSAVKSAADKARDQFKANESSYNNSINKSTSPSTATQLANAVKLQNKAQSVPEWQQKLNSYQTNKSAAAQEIQRAKDVYAAEKAAGASQERLNQISRWADQVRAAAGISNDDPIYGNNPRTFVGGQSSGWNTVSTNNDGQVTSNVMLTNQDVLNRNNTTVDPSTGTIWRPVTSDGIIATSNNPIMYSATQQQQPVYQTQIADPQFALDNTLREFSYGASQSLSNPDFAAMYAKGYESLLQTINQAEASIRQQFQQQMGGVDPATESALARLKESVQQQRDRLMEEMSRRGLLQSGIWLEMEDRINKGQLSAEQQMLGERISDLQNRLTQSLMNFASMRVGAQQTFSLEGAQAMERDLQRSLDEAWRKKQFGLQEFQATAPYSMLTESQRQQQPLQWASTIGEVPQGPGVSGVQQDPERFGRGATTTREQAEQNENRLNTDPSFRNSEIERTLRVINERRNAGMDTSLQERYLNRLRTGGW